MEDNNSRQNNTRETDNQSASPISGTHQENLANTQKISEYHCRQKPEKWHDLGLQDRCMILLTLGILLVAGISAYIVLGQFNEMSIQTSFLSDQVRGDAVSASLRAVQAQNQLTIGQKQAKAAQDSANAIQRQTIQEDRPWVGIDVAPASDFIFNQEIGGSIMLKFTLTNVGHSLAKYVSVWTDLVMDDNWQAAQKRICGIPKARINAKSDYGYLLFPNQIITDVIPAAARPDHAKQSLAKSPFGGEMVSLNVVVCVDYKSVIDPEHHQTRLVRGVSFPDHQKGVMMGAFEAKHRYNELVFMPRLHGDSAD